MDPFQMTVVPGFAFRGCMVYSNCAKDTNIYFDKQGWFQGKWVTQDSFITVIYLAISIFSMACGEGRRIGTQVTWV